MDNKQREVVRIRAEDFRLPEVLKLVEQGKVVRVIPAEKKENVIGASISIR